MALQVLFFGTSEFAIPILAVLSESEEINLKGVATQPDKPAGRRQELTPPPVKIYAEEKGIPVLQPEKVKKNKDFLEFIKDLNLDFIVVVSYGQILPLEVLNTAKYGAINVHPSLLPKYRGSSPIQQALLNGDQITGVTIMKMNEKMDAGDIVLVKKMEIDEQDNYEILEKKLAMLSSQMIIPVLSDYAEGILRPIPQNDAQATYCSKFEKKDGKIDFQNETADQINNKIRAFSLWPVAHTFWQGKMLKIKKASVQKNNGSGKPGSVHFLDTKISVQCKEDLLMPEIVQLEGKKEMSIEDFLRGYEKELRRNSLFGN